FANVLRINATVALNRQVSHLESVLFQALAGVEHSFVFDRLGDDVIALLAVHLGDALDHQVVAFSGSASEDDLFRSSGDQRGDLRASVFHGLFPSPAKGVVAAGGVAELFGEIRQHGANNARIDRRGGVIVHVNRQFYSHVPLPKSATR